MTAMAQRILNDPQVRFTALGFRGANHGIKSSFINNHFRGDKKVPTFDWPLIDYPKNQSDESRALEDTLKQLKQSRHDGTPVAAIVVSPLHAFKGTAASQEFIDELGKLAREAGAAMVIDATSTNAGASGKNFWGVNADTADYLVFGRRSYVEGFYCRPQAKYAAITFGGDYLRMLQFKVLKETIEKERLIEKVGKVSGYFR